MLPNVLDNLIIVLVCAPKWLACIDVRDLRLLSFDTGEGVAMTCVKARLLSVPFEAYGIRIDAVQPAKCLDEREPTVKALAEGETQECAGTHAFLRSSGDNSPRSGSVMILPLTNSMS